MKKLPLILTLALFSLPTGSSAQQPAGLHSAGQDFYFAQLAPSIHCPNLVPYQGFYALISSFYDCLVSVSYFDLDGAEVNGASFGVKAGGGVQIQLDQNFVNPMDSHGNPRYPDGETPEYIACHIHASGPSTVSYYSSGPNSGSMMLVLPVQVLGKNYVIASLPANPGMGATDGTHTSNSNCLPDSGSSEFAVLAVADSTSVTIIPSGLTRKGDVGTNTGQGATGAEHPIQFTLSRGEVYWIKSTTDDPTNDMSGSMVMASKPVAVFAGNGDALHGTSDLASEGGDQRNMILQQMVPVQYWRSSDYIGIPFIDMPTLDAGNASAGDEYKVFTADSVSTSLSFAVTDYTTQQRSLAQPKTPIAPFENVEAATNAWANRPIEVEQYDYKAQGGSPNTAPTMMNIVPLKNFEREYCFQVPNDKSSLEAKRYISVIARKSQFGNIRVRHGNGTPVTLDAMQQGTSYSIPNHAELVGKRYEVSPGTFMMTGDSAFAVYQYGMLGLDPDYDLGNNDDDDYYFEYAEPAGESFGIDGAGIPTVAVDTICGGWNITAHDTAALDGGICTIQILKDPLGVFARKSNTDSGYISTNVDFDPASFAVAPGETSVTTSIKVDNRSLPGTAWVLVTNVGGQSVLLQLNYDAPMLTLSPDSLVFNNSLLSSDTCAQFVLRNSAGVGRPPIIVSSARLLQGNQGFVSSSTSLQLPDSLVPGDSIVFTICFQPPKHSIKYIDTLEIQAGCQSLVEPLQGSGVLGNINASDLDFGNVLVGHTKCANLHVWNTGSAPVILTKQWVLDNLEDFTFEDSAELPLTLQPGVANGVDLGFCFYLPTRARIQPQCIGVPICREHIRIR